MKVNFKSMMIALFAMATAFASCSKDDNENNLQNGTTRSVQIKIKQAIDPTSRAVGDQVANATPVTFASGKLLFANGGNKITMIVDIVAGANAYESGEVGIEALEATNGAWITGVPATSTQVCFIGNVPSGVTIAVNDDVTALEATVTSQWKTDGSVDNVTIWGDKALTKCTEDNADGDKYEAAFTAKPIVGRFEIGAITPGGDIDAYRIEGIFIDDYYNEMAINGTAIAADLQHNYSDKAKYTLDAIGSSYTTAMLGRVFDYNATGLTIPNRPEEGIKEAWAYNLLAPTSASPAMPKIIIRLDGIKVKGEDWSGPQFLTIKNFYSDPAGDKTLITKLEQGNIYVIPNITFTESDLTPEPYLKNKDVRVDVTLMNWESKDIGYDFN